MKPIKISMVLLAACLISVLSFLFGVRSAMPPDYQYQITLEDDSIHVENNGRYVGSVPYSDSPIDSLFLKDNE
jgi:hypothetical protein